MARSLPLDSTGRRLWVRHEPAPIEAIAFRAGDARVATAGIQDHEQRRVRFIEYDTGTGGTTYDGEPQLDPGSVHVAFSVDGETLIADYDYESIAFWNVASRVRMDRHYRFGDPSGMRFDLGYDVVRNLTAIRMSAAGVVIGELPGGVSVVLKQEGQGTTIVPQGTGTPVLSAFSRTEENLYPVRGADLLSPSGRWFVLSTNVTTVDRASGLRVYDFVSGYPVTELLVHAVTGRPGDAWPRLLSKSEGELDPVQAIAFLEETGTLVTVTTNGIVRHWSVLRPSEEAPFWSRPAELGAALTGRRLISARALQDPARGVRPPSPEDGGRHCQEPRRHHAAVVQRRGCSVPGCWSPPGRSGVIYLARRQRARRRPFTDNLDRRLRVGGHRAGAWALRRPVMPRSPASDPRPEGGWLGRRALTPSFPPA